MSHNKYNAKRVITPDGVFDSKKEAKRYYQLKALQDAGDIQDLQCQVTFQLLPAQEWHHPVKAQKGPRMYKRAKKAEYIADFVYKDKQGHTIVEDVKGKKTEVYNLKKKLMLYFYDIQIEEV